MSVFGRISKLISANINSLLDQAEDPELMVKQLIRDMEESIIELRRETVRAVARQKQLEKQIQAAGDLTEVRIWVRASDATRSHELIEAFFDASEDLAEEV